LTEESLPVFLLEEKELLLGADLAELLQLQQSSEINYI
jgi:hypothetical protein